MPNLKLWLAVALCIGLLTWFGLHQYGAAREASVRGEILGNAVSEAVEERKGDLKADASVASKNRVRVDAAKRTTQKAREFLRDSQTTNAPVLDSGDALARAEFSRLLNASIAGSNRAVESARSLSE